MITALNSPFLLLIVALILGAIVGLEREAAYIDANDKDKNLGGLRTFALISFTGGLVGLIDNSNLALIITTFFFILLTASYIASSLKTEYLGITTEIAAIFMYVLGYSLTGKILPVQLAISLTIILSMVLSIKTQVHKFALGVTQKEVNAFIGFAIIALVILPFLPNKYFYLNDFPALNSILETYGFNTKFINTLDVFNPAKIWTFVVLISGIEVIGYIFNKLAGQKKGLLLSSILAGFVSSIPVTISLANKSKKNPHNINEFLQAAILTNTASQSQLLFLIAPLNPKWFVNILPIFIVLIIVEIVFSKIALRINHKQVSTLFKSEDNISNEDTEIFNIKLALKMTLILVLVSIFTKISLIFFGEGGFIISSMISSLSGTDAVIINIAQIAGNAISFDVSAVTFLAVITANLMGKSFLSYLNGNKEYAKTYTVFSFLTILLCLSIYVFWKNLGIY